MLKLNLPAGGQKSKQKGQAILILILVMTVALAIGLSIVQKSLVDVSTSSKVEQSSRAFSAAEAGIETALRSVSNASCSNCQDFSGSKIQEIADVDKIPCIPGQVACAQAANVQQAPLEFPRLSKEDVMQAWLADPQASLPACTASDICYQQDTLDVYWGDPDHRYDLDKPALELTLVYYDLNVTPPQFKSKKWYLDPDSSRSGPSNNGFEDVSSRCGGGHTPSGGVNTYRCKYTLTNLPVPTAGVANRGQVMLIRPRLHYNQNPQYVAFQAVGTAVPPTNRVLPPTARSIISTGTSGETQRKIKLYQIYNMVPPYFDYAIFSIGEIIK